MTRRLALVAALAAVGVTLTACDLSMTQQRKLKTYAPTALWPDGTSARPLPADVVAQGDVARAAEAKTPPAAMQLVDWTGELNDFADTAALIGNLDLVISVDTSVVHLAGAMGKPVWTLLRFAAHWVWLLERQDSPWYPTMRLFRQPTIGDWQSVVRRVAESLADFVRRGQVAPCDPRP